MLLNCCATSPRLWTAASLAGNLTPPPLNSTPASIELRSVCAAVWPILAARACDLLRGAAVPARGPNAATSAAMSTSALDNIEFDATSRSSTAAAGSMGHGASAIADASSAGSDASPVVDARSAGRRASAIADAAVAIADAASVYGASAWRSSRRQRSSSSGESTVQLSKVLTGVQRLSALGGELMRLAAGLQRPGTTPRAVGLQRPGSGEVVVPLQRCRSSAACAPPCCIDELAMPCAGLRSPTQQTLSMHWHAATSAPNWPTPRKARTRADSHRARVMSASYAADESATSAARTSFRKRTIVGRRSMSRRTSASKMEPV